MTDVLQPAARDRGPAGAEAVLARDRADGFEAPDRSPQDRWLPGRVGSHHRTASGSMSALVPALADVEDGRFDDANLARSGGWWPAIAYAPVA